MKWTLLVVVALLSTPVFAKGKARARAENAEAAAQKAMAEGEFERALTLLDQAVAKAPAGDRARLHLLSAQCRLALQDEERAMGSMTKALESDPTIVPDPNKTGPEVLHLFDKVRQQLAGALTVTANQPEVELFLDGRPIGSAPVKIEIPVGRHTVQAQTADGQKLEEIVVMQVRGEGKIAFALNAPRQPNDEPLVKPTKPVKTSKTTTTTAANVTPSVHQSASKPSRAPLFLGVSGGVLTAAGATALVLSQLDANTLKKDASLSVQQVEQTARQGELKQLGGWIGIGAGAGLLVLSTVLGLSASPAQVSVVVHSQGAVLAVGGSLP